MKKEWHATKGVSDKAWWCDTPSVTSLFNGKRLAVDSKLKQI